MNELQNGKLLVAGGGTGGHVLAGIAVADAWKMKWKRNNDSILFVGAFGGIEEKLVSRTGYDLRLLKLGSLNRVSFRRKVKTFYQLPFALVRSASILLSWRPDFILGVGGYASGPIVLMARMLKFLRLVRIRIGILEQNAVPGFTNRLLARFSDLVFVTFPSTEKEFANIPVLITGNPIRSSISPMTSSTGAPFTVFIFGGSQGAIGINTLILEALPHFKQIRDQIQFIHQTGVKDYQRVCEGHWKNQTHARVEKYIDDMANAYSQSSVIVCRAGSSTLSELAAVGRCAILIPLPSAADNHQEKNARVFSDAGAARILVQTSSSGRELAQMILDLKAHPTLISTMEQKIRRFYRPNAAEDVVKGLTEFYV